MLCIINNAIKNNDGLKASLVWKKVQVLKLILF